MFVCKWDHSIGTNINQNHQNLRHAVAVNSKGHVFVTQPEQLCVQVYSETGKLLTTLSDKHMCLPEAVAVTHALEGSHLDLVFVLDSGDCSILKFHILANHNAELLCRIRCNVFQMPSGLACYRNRIYVTDAEANQLHILTDDGAIIKSIGSSGAQRGQFSMPSAVAISAKRGEVFVCDTGNDRIQVFDYNGEYIRSFGSSGSSNGNFQHPTGVTVSDTLDVVAVADQGNHRIQAFDLIMLGRLVWLIQDDIFNPASVAFDAEDDILVSDETGAQWFAPPSAGEKASESCSSPSSSSSISESFDTENEELDSQALRPYQTRSPHHTGSHRLSLRSPSKSDLFTQSHHNRIYSDSSAEESSDGSEDDDADQFEDDGDNAIENEGEGEGSQDDEQSYDEQSYDEQFDEDEESDISANDNQENYNIQVLAPMVNQLLQQKQKGQIQKKSAWQGSDDATARGSLGRAGHRVHQEYVRDSLALKEEIIQLRREVTNLENHRAIIREEKAAMDRELLTTLDTNDTNRSFAAVQLQAAQPRNRALDSREAIEACHDLLLLEERLLELNIMQKDLKRSLPTMRKQVTVEEERSLQLSSERTRVERVLDETLSGLATPESQEQRSELLKAQIKRCEQDLAHLVQAHQNRLNQLQKDKDELSIMLRQKAEDLYSLRQRIQKEKLRRSMEATNSSHQAIQNELNELKTQFDYLGGQDQLVRVAFDSIVPKRQHTLDCEQILHALRYCAQYAPHETGAIKDLNLHDVEQYVSLVTQADAVNEPLRLDITGLRDAFRDLCRNKSVHSDQTSKK